MAFEDQAPLLSTLVSEDQAIQATADFEAALHPPDVAPTKPIGPLPDISARLKVTGEDLSKYLQAHGAFAGPYPTAWHDWVKTVDELVDILGIEREEVEQLIAEFQAVRAVNASADIAPPVPDPPVDINPDGANPLVEP